VSNQVQIEQKEVLLYFEFRHRNDWTRHTYNMPYKFTSIAWYPFLNSANVEIIFARTLRKDNDSVIDYFDKMESKGLIYELIAFNEIFKNNYVISFSDPYNNTVRENILNFKIFFYNSSIQNGVQRWNIIIEENKLWDFFESIRGLGKIIKYDVKKLNKHDIVGLILKNNIITKYIGISFTESELNVINKLVNLGYFNEYTRPTLSEISRLMSRDKSTIDRQLKSAIRKLVKLINLTLP